MQGLSIYAYVLQVTSRDGGEQALKRSLEALAMPETPVALLGPAGKRRKVNQILLDTRALPRQGSTNSQIRCRCQSFSL